MDKATLKKMLKPLMKECVREIIMEQGLSSIIKEAVQPAEKKQIISNITNKKQHVANQQPEQKQELTEKRKEMLESINKSGYLNSKFDPFNDTKPLTESQATDGAAASGPLAGIDPSDPGIDISGFINNNTNKWKALVGGKG